MSGPASSPGRLALGRFLEDRLAVAGIVFLALALLLAGIGPGLLGVDPDRAGESPLAPPGAGHWMGTDIHGRDLLARVLVGLRISLAVGAVGAAVSLLIGVGWGVVSGAAGGRTDAWMMRGVDLLQALPTVVWVMLGMTLFEARCAGWLAERWPAALPALRLGAMMICLGSVSWLTMARVIRGQTLALRERPFLLAATALGVPPVRWFLRHLLPNLSGVILVYLTLTVPAVVLYESFLSFLGLGVRPPQASLGTLIADGASQLNPIRVRWWLLVFPAGLMALLLAALTSVGEGLRAAFEPRGGDGPRA
ncbi:MAG: ABC transporter permease [Verrucomicrobia bacterium]|nr:ABC transporter permease [Verrucomicrobiota bacterium]